jgi:hypothetical protein
MPDTHLDGPAAGGDLRPRPDPTVLTTEASNRLETMLRNLITAEARHITELLAKDMAHVELQFKTIAERTAEQKSDTKSALDAALAAAKEAVTSQTASSEKAILKSETASVERIKGLETLLATSLSSTDEKITDIKDRVIAIEAIKLGATEAGSTARAISGDARGSRDSFIAIVGIGVLFMAPVLAFLASHFH